MSRPAPPAVMQIVGYKDSGKTTLISRLLPLFSHMKLRVAVIKHDAHGFEIDHDGTDTYAFRRHGAAAIAITSPYRTALIEEQETSLMELIARFGGYDLILVEGYKREAFPKIVMLRSEEDRVLLQELNQVKAYVVRETETAGNGKAANEIPRTAKAQSGPAQLAGTGQALRGGEVTAAPFAHFAANELEKIAAWVLSEAGLTPLAE
ncbi:molybdopterin-guanine dinucleotide biosynthesis protein B [Paenibacillus sp. GM2]|uniref:molybdopterin-guanine dinucleotide biosynthesis protein B n=1 Tax=Paenibacillus sp. GM2 TaxID=1622070 RepID=UPI000838A6D7|nr:molybdopterin-guanine dinucleotide biosynthesis protein B [Paenibacillus sp. GM2]